LIDVEIYFLNSEGDLQLELFGPFDSLTPRFKSNSTFDDEYISYAADVSGDWRIRVYHEYGNTNVTYDMYIFVYPGDDWAEENDDFWSARGIGLPTYHSSLMVVDSDEDWFQFFLNPGDIIDVYIYFSQFEGDLQLVLYDPFYINRTASLSNNSGEYLHFMADLSGDWRIQVYHKYGNSTVLYDLEIFLFTGTIGDDWMEENDDYWSAWWLGPSYHSGLMIVDYDEDWFQLYLNTGDTIDISIFFDHYFEGNLELELYDPFNSFSPREGSYSMDSDEFITYTADVSGEWRIKVYHKDGNSTVN
jgi:hypothetical protein